MRMACNPILTTEAPHRGTPQRHGDTEERLRELCVTSLTCFLTTDSLIMLATAAQEMEQILNGAERV